MSRRRRCRSFVGWFGGGVDWGGLALFLFKWRNRLSAQHRSVGYGEAGRPLRRNRNQVSCGWGVGCWDVFLDGDGRMHARRRAGVVIPPAAPCFYLPQKPPGASINRPSTQISRPNHSSSMSTRQSMDGPTDFGMAQPIHPKCSPTLQPPLVYVNRSIDRFWSGSAASTTRSSGSASRASRTTTTTTTCKCPPPLLLPCVFWFVLPPVRAPLACFFGLFLFLKKKAFCSACLSCPICMHICARAAHACAYGCVHLCPSVHPCHRPFDHRSTPPPPPLEGTRSTGSGSGTSRRTWGGRRGRRRTRRSSRPPTRRARASSSAGCVGHVVCFLDDESGAAW